MSRSEILGSWFNSGYYGHQRSKQRSEWFSYRRDAAPQPPPLFLKRFQTDASQHVFSKHDSRQILLTGAHYLEESIGRRRAVSSNNRSRYDRDFLAWVPHPPPPASGTAAAANKENASPADATLAEATATVGSIENACPAAAGVLSATAIVRAAEDQPLSSYTTDYQGPDTPRFNHRLVRHLHGSASEATRAPISVYQSTYCLASHDPSLGQSAPGAGLRQQLGCTLNRPVTTGTFGRSSTMTPSSQRILSRRVPLTRNTVANCLSWYVPPMEKHPAGTQTEGSVPDAGAIAEANPAEAAGSGSNGSDAKIEFSKSSENQPQHIVLF